MIGSVSDDEEAMGRFYLIDLQPPRTQFLLLVGHRKVRGSQSFQAQEELLRKTIRPERTILATGSIERTALSARDRDLPLLLRDAYEFASLAPAEKANKASPAANKGRVGGNGVPTGRVN